MVSILSFVICNHLYITEFNTCNLSSKFRKGPIETLAYIKLTFL